MCIRDRSKTSSLLQPLLLQKPLLLHPAGLPSAPFAQLVQDIRREDNWSGVSVQRAVGRCRRQQQSPVAALISSNLSPITQQHSLRPRLGEAAAYFAEVATKAESAEHGPRLCDPSPITLCLTPPAPSAAAGCPNCSSGPGKALWGWRSAPSGHGLFPVRGGCRRHCGR